MAFAPFTGEHIPICLSCTLPVEVCDKQSIKTCPYLQKYGKDGKRVDLHQRSCGVPDEPIQYGFSEIYRRAVKLENELFGKQRTYWTRRNELENCA